VRTRVYAALLDTLTAARILSIEALFWNTGGVCARISALPSDAGFQGKAVSKRKQTAVGLQVGMWSPGRNSIPRRAATGPSSRPFGPEQSAARTSLDRSRRQIFRGLPADGRVCLCPEGLRSFPAQGQAKDECGNEFCFVGVSAGRWRRRRVFRCFRSC
jgi:hypothetical protein